MLHFCQNIYKIPLITIYVYDYNLNKQSMGLDLQLAALAVSYYCLWHCCISLTIFRTINRTEDFNVSYPFFLKHMLLFGLFFIYFVVNSYTSSGALPLCLPSICTK